MALSRFRLRLTAGVAVAVFVGIAAMEGASYGYVIWNGSREFNDRLKDAAAGARTVIRQEAGRINVDSNVFDGVNQTLRDWTPSKLAFVVYDSAGVRIATGGDSAMIRRLPDVSGLPDVGDVDAIPLPSALHLRYAADTVHGTHVVVAASTDVLRRRQRGFLTRVTALLPLVLLLALVIAYLLTRFALAPIDALGRAADAISPGDLGGRLPVHRQPDELDHLALRFNGLLDRIQALQDKSHRFLREVAHQIRTPLTLVLGETELGLERT
ncbi:MAG: HAMP domain-containing protein, partial [Gemmatimonadales bacterium]